MRILLVSPQFQYIGGIAESVDNLAREFLNLGHEVRVAANPYAPPDGVVVSREVEPTLVRISGIKPVTWRHPERLFRDSAHRELTNLIRCIAPDVVNSHIGAWERIPTVVRSCRVAGVPLVYTLHGRGGAGNQDASALMPLKTADAIVTNSAYTRRDFAQLAPWLSRATVIMVGVDVASAERAAPTIRERPYVFCAARLTLREKAVDVLISAFRAVAEDYPELDLLIAGSGPDADKLEKLAREIGLGGRIHFLGTVPRAEMWGLFKGALFFAMPSRRPEGLGLVFLESMACGRPVIGTNSGGTPEAVSSGETGFLLERNEPTELALAMRRMLEDPEAREAMGRRAYEAALLHSWSHVAESYLRLFRSCVEQRSHRSEQ